MTSNQKFIQVAVCGAHMTGLPLNTQLTSLGGTFIEETTTAPEYKLYKLNGFTPVRPGLLRVVSGGAAITLEVWQLPIENYGTFVSGVPAPLGFGTLTLADGRAVNGFLCEHYATLNSTDISDLSGWRNFLKTSD
ncbi:MAG: amidase [Methylotenera sp.]|uniref:allophanate hydrolase-related protein n=1 Tax=Methylotenera sp. TaxID=2051956 RepID=UPI002488B8AA|nr:amidase [Methylotenera sp.]MDI1310091.1 amidase [Methylotenera sp.]